MKTSLDRTMEKALTTYRCDECTAFRKTKEAFGGLSNMAAGYPLLVAGARPLTSEALCQCCRFPLLPDVQRLIIRQASPMAAKMVSKPHRSQTRPDWDDVRGEIMRWCQGVKLVQHCDTFGPLLLSTGAATFCEMPSENAVD
jgi:predicted NAD-dependent protein-ADP-ribosyltransferase YbiA (DUF1768 family)